MSSATSDFQRAARDAVATTKDSIDDVKSRVQEKLSDVGSSAREALHDGRLTAAEALDGAAKGMHSRADRLGQAGHNAADTVRRVGHDAADRVDSTANWVRSHGASDIITDVEHYVKQNPGKSLMVAAAVGFLVGRKLRSNE